MDGEYGDEGSELLIPPRREGGGTKARGVGRAFRAFDEVPAADGVLEGFNGGFTRDCAEGTVL